MTSVFDFDDSINTIYNAKTAGKNLVTAKHEVLTKAGEFLFLAHTDKEFALRCQMMEADIESAARRKMASVSDSKFKLVRALHEEWKIRHANCGMCNLKESATMCRECKKRPATKKAHGYLDVCNECDPKSGTTASKFATFSGKCLYCKGPVDPENHTFQEDLEDYENPETGSLEWPDQHICHNCISPLTCPNCGSTRNTIEMGRGTPIHHQLRDCQDCGTKLKSLSTDMGGREVEASKFATYPPQPDDPAEEREYARQLMEGEPSEFGLDEDNPLAPRKDTLRIPMQTKQLDVKAEAGPEWEPDNPRRPRIIEELRERHLTNSTASKSEVQEKISSLKTRIDSKTAMAMEQDRISKTKTDNSITSDISPEDAQRLAARFADRRADLPEMKDEAKAGRWAIITKHTGDGSIVNATLGRIGGSAIGGEAETSPLICTGNTHHGINGPCVHSADDAFGGRHIGVQETPLVEFQGENVFPRISGRKEASIYAPSHRVYVLPKEHHDFIEQNMNRLASEGLPDFGIPPFKREEEGRGTTIETFGRSRPNPSAGPGINTTMGRSHGVGKISNFTIWPSDANFGHFENQVAKERGGNESYAEMLESGPRDITNGRSNAGAVTTEFGKAGSGRVLPVASMVPMYEDSDFRKGLQGGLADGSLERAGVTAKLRPVAWGNASDAGTFKPLGGKIKSVGEALRKKLVELNTERAAGIVAESAERAKAKAPGTGGGTSTKNQLTQDALNKILGK